MNNLQLDQIDETDAFPSPIDADEVNPPGANGGGVLALLKSLETSAAPEPASARAASDVRDNPGGFWEIALVAVGSLAAHVGVAQALPSNTHEKPVRVSSKVEIAFVRPPTPAVIPPQVEKPTPPRPRSQRAAAPKPVEPPPEPAETPPPVEEAAAAPPGPEGTEVATPSDSFGIGTHGDAPAAPPAPTPPPVVAPHEGANYLQNPRPAYPALAMSRGWQGKVLLRVHVGPDGRPRAISVAQGSGRQLLDDAAIAAVRGWSFVPARQGGAPVAGWVSVPIVFELK